MVLLEENTIEISGDKYTYTYSMHFYTFEETK